MSEPVVLTRDELAALLRVSVRTVDRLPIKSLKLGRRRLFRREDVDAYLEDLAA